MLQTQSQNEEIRQIRDKVADEVRHEVFWKVGDKVGNEVWWKVEVGFTTKNNVRKWLFFS